MRDCSGLPEFVIKSSPRDGLYWLLYLLPPRVAEVGRLEVVLVGPSSIPAPTLGILLVHVLFL